MYIRMTGGRPDPHPGSGYRIRDGQWQARILQDGFYQWINCLDPRLSDDNFATSQLRSLGINVIITDVVEPGTFWLV